MIDIALRPRGRVLELLILGGRRRPGTPALDVTPPAHPRNPDPRNPDPRCAAE